MAISCYINEWPGAALDVDNPGNGEIDVYLPRQDGLGIEVKLLGVSIGLALQEVTMLALSSGLADRVHGLGSLTVGEARLLLPVLQKCAIYAAGGSNAAEGLFDGDAPRWCTNCGEGAIYVTQECRTAQRPDASCARTDWCDQFGHAWFAGRAPADDVRARSFA